MPHQTMPARRRRRRGFTLIELLVVISIIAVLVGILLAALGRARDHARTVQCGTQLHQVGIAMGSYLEDSRQMIFWRGPDLNGNGTFDLNEDGMDWFVWAGRETDNVVVAPQDDLFNRIVPRPLNVYTNEPELVRCPDDDSEWINPMAGGRNLYDFIGNSYMFNSNGPPWDFEPGNVPATAALRGLGGKRYDRIAQPALTVMFLDASLPLAPWLRHHQKGNVLFGDSHVAQMDRETLMDPNEATWRAE